MKAGIPETDALALTSWKDIAQYMGKGVRTVQRWEQEFGLPVRRPAGITHKSAVLAYRHDIDAWLESSWSLRRKMKTVSGASGRRMPDAMKDNIATAHVLRAEHGVLVKEIRAVLDSLVKNCGRLSRGSSSMD
jgi:hypothetical protein